MIYNMFGKFIILRQACFMDRMTIWGFRHGTVVHRLFI